MNDSTERATRESHTDVASREGAQPAKPLIRTAPAVDVFEDSHGITLYADLPGVPREKLDVRVQDGSLNIEAEAVIPTPPGLRPQHDEVRHPHFWRAFTLSPDFDVSRIDAQLRDGVLKLTIPRREGAKPRRIEVRVGQTYAQG
ncbi:Hsp20/alpha crystallin family protein [Paraburkholderia unamae]|uniref:HSP20 family molecular chaperone IbpA n=1 Tax=Paraburkholderia unamae TaxID=219649 RepID=A0ABX5KS91_9BURK|nr:Hsp20/alpha crystallin family protein [Paraburkholderia unamae]PVX85724.1 HSP20 family molecular chaperone IbpA [Paraburkholderia unamae]